MNLISSRFSLLGAVAIAVVAGLVLGGPAWAGGGGDGDGVDILPIPGMGDLSPQDRRDDSTIGGQGHSGGPLGGFIAIGLVPFGNAEGAVPLMVLRTDDAARDIQALVAEIRPMMSGQGFSVALAFAHEVEGVITGIRATVLHPTAPEIGAGDATTMQR